MQKTLNLLLLVVCSLSLRAQTSCGFEGTWNTDWDGVSCILTMHMEDDDVSMTGSYSYTSTNYTTIRGQVSGNIIEILYNEEENNALVTMVGRWQQGSISGSFEFSRTCAGTELSGFWRNDNGQESGNWSGMKQ
jgi:hypothetical protein